MGVLDRGEDQVLDDLFFVGMEDGGVNVERGDDAFGGGGGFDQTRTAFAGDSHAFQLFLHLAHFGLHFLSFLHHPGHIAKTA